MTPDPAPDTSALEAFEQRVLTRDVPPVPEPPRRDVASVQQRLRQALRQRLGRQASLQQRTLSTICYRFLTVPQQFSTDAELVEILGLSAGTLTRAWRKLRQLGLVEPVPAGRRRAYRLSRAGEDWLLAVAKGEPA